MCLFDSRAEHEERAQEETEVLGVSPAPAPLMPRTFSRGRLTLPVSPSRTLGCIAVGDPGVSAGLPETPAQWFHVRVLLRVTPRRARCLGPAASWQERRVHVRGSPDALPSVCTEKFCLGSQRMYTLCNVCYRQSVYDGSDAVIFGFNRTVRR